MCLLIVALFYKAEKNNEPQPAKTVPVFVQSETFDSSLQAIMKRVSSVYGVEILFANPEKSSLKMHLEVDSGLSINEFVELLNNFEVCLPGRSRCRCVWPLSARHHRTSRTRGMFRACRI